MIKIGVLGYGGRMGKLIAEEIIARKTCKLAYGIVHKMKPEYEKTGFLISHAFEDVIADSDVVIDFTTASATPVYAQIAAKHGKAFVSGTTGLDAEAIKALKDISKKIPLLYAANTSLSLAAMKQITTLAAKLLGNLAYDVAITDAHHAQKKDAPSGTAKALGEAIIAGSAGKKSPSYSSVREGEIVGEHDVIFTGNGESIRLHHSVTDRRIFAKGAVEAALWLHGKKPGFYGMDDVLGLKP